MRKRMLDLFMSILGLIAIAWAATAIREYAMDASLAATATAILSGDKFSATQLSSIKSRLQALQTDPSEPAALRGTAIMRMSLLEEQLKSQNRMVSVSDYDRLQSNLIEALAKAPTDSFLWLAAFWLKGLRVEPTANDPNLLRMSFLLGPNEGWIAIKRANVAFGVFGSLPPDLAHDALMDFVGLVRSDSRLEAADILQGAGWAIRDQLLNGLLMVDLGDRTAFAKVLAARNIDDVTVPGVESSRPF
jgi:hypothetical protein